MIPCSSEEYFYKVDNMVLSSSQHIRDVFKSRWKSETNEEWVDDKTNIQKFLKGIGANALKRAPGFQKKALNESDSLGSWDVSLLSFVIQNFGDELKYEKENLAVRKLKDMRNKLAHHTTKKLTAEEYNENVQKFKDNLQILGIVKNDIDKLIERAGVTSSLKAYERVKGLFGEAEKLMKAGKIEKAVELYSDAINTPSLLPVNLGEAYEKRANCYLKSVKSQIDDDKHCDQALLDLKKALELNSSSWNAHYLAAQCHRKKNNLPEAIQFYQKSIAISPAQQQVKRDLDTCKVLAGIQTREDYLNPGLMPMNLEERVKHWENETGIKLTGEQFLEMTTGKLAGKLFKGQDHVGRGHQYFAGWGVAQDYNEAIKYYAKADKVGNPEGSYNLARCYHYGYGVKQDVKKALQIYRRVAAMDKNIKGLMTPLQCNAGVASAQHSIGLMYTIGIGVERDHKEAAKWYKMAMENGIGEAANNLGLLYFEGKGVPVDEKMAEMCWKEAINLGDCNAPAALMIYYKTQLEPDKMLNMVRIGREMGNNTLKSLTDEELNRMLEEVKRARCMAEGEVTEFEKLHNLDVKGLKFKERVTRFTRKHYPGCEKILEIQENMKRHHMGLGVHNDSWGGKWQNKNGDVIKAINLKAKQGSETACRILQTLLLSMELNDVLENISLESTNYDTEKLKVLNLIYECVTLEFQHMFYRSQEIRQKLKSIIAQLFEEKCEEKGENDMKIRLCFCAVNLGNSLMSLDDMYALEILKEGVRRYPNNPNYYYYILCCILFKKMFKEGLSYANEANKNCPGQAEVLNYRAVIMRNLEMECSDVVQAYEEFLKVAPRDHREFPEAFYQMSSVHLTDYVLEACKTEKKLHLVKSTFKQGQEAEKDQLPCYLPYGESDLKISVETFLSAKQSTRMPISLDANPKAEIIKVLEKKPYLKSSARKGVIRQHRQNFKCTHGTVENDLLKVTNTVAPKLKQTLAKKMSMVTPITLNKMNPTEDNIYENRILDLTIIDEPNPNRPSIHCVAEDENMEVTRLYIYNVNQEKETMEMFQAGCRLAIINPYMRIGAQSINGIRNDEPRCIVYLEKVKDMCRLCGEENAAHKCSKCKRPYCSRECQTLDWKELDHKLICSIR